MVGRSVKPDHDKEVEPWCAISGTMLAELEVQRTMKRAELLAFTITLSCLIEPLNNEHGQHGHH